MQSRDWLLNSCGVGSVEKACNKRLFKFTFQRQLAIKLFKERNCSGQIFGDLGCESLSLGFKPQNPVLFLIQVN